VLLLNPRSAARDSGQTLAVSNAKLLSNRGDVEACTKPPFMMRLSGSGEVLLVFRVGLRRGHRGKLAGLLAALGASLRLRPGLNRDIDIEAGACAPTVVELGPRLIRQSRVFSAPNRCEPLNLGHTLQPTRS
jgi:hypothetical protein